MQRRYYNVVDAATTAIASKLNQKRTPTPTPNKHKEERSISCRMLSIERYRICQCDTKIEECSRDEKWHFWRHRFIDLEEIVLFISFIFDEHDCMLRWISLGSDKRTSKFCH